MKPAAANRTARRYQRQQGSILMVTLFVSAMIGLTLASYLTLVSATNRSITRSDYWNSGIPLAEAGIEEALAHMHQNCITNSMLGKTLLDFEMDGWAWTDNDKNVITKTRELDGGSYTVTISFVNPDAPEIISTGKVTESLSRTIRVVTLPQPMFTKALVSKDRMDLKGNNIRTDSFNSRIEGQNVNGRYSESVARDKGDIATNLAIEDSLHTGNAAIWGHASTGPGGTIAMGPNAAIGSVEWHTKGNKGVEPGWTTDDMNVDFPDVEMPFQGGLQPHPGKTWDDGVKYDMVFEDGTYAVTTGEFGGNILVTGNAVVRVDVRIRLSGNDRIVIAEGASLRLYANTPSATISGQGVQNPGNATAFYYFGLPKNTSISYSGNTEFTGIFYAPQAHFTLGGGGSGDFHFSGSAIVGQVTMNGNYKFHYDEGLMDIGIKRGYIAVFWEEL